MLALCLSTWAPPAAYNIALLISLPGVGVLNIPPEHHLKYHQWYYSSIAGWEILDYMDQIFRAFYVTLLQEGT